jgi:hypothetical protein
MEVSFAVSPPFAVRQTTGGRQPSIPPVAPSVAASKHKSVRIETCSKGTITNVNNASWPEC